MNNKKLIIFGEVLYDCFPGGEKVLGGAPFNVAWHLQAFGQSPSFVSRVGRDSEGDTILRTMSRWGMETEGVQQDADHATGKVTITINHGEPSYEIVADAAYDFIDPLPLQDTACDTLYHGSLGLRNSIARSALDQLKKSGAETIFLDVNLRPPWWNRKEILDWVSQADWVKLNRHELEQLLGQSSDLLSQAMDFKTTYGLQGVIVTRGEKGAIVLAGNGDRPLEIVPEPILETVDTVGAGDAFTSVILLGLMKQWSLESSLKRAQAFASAIVGQRGATVSSASFYSDFMAQWN
ncbi:MAG: carbohydrate kinase [Candidatus Thiodiazotropha sp. 6PLUC2]